LTSLIDDILASYLEATAIVVIIIGSMSELTMDHDAAFNEAIRAAVADSF
jgi:hypothetical protein